MTQEQSSQPKTYNLVGDRPQAIVIHCSDPRFQQAFREFIHEELKLADGEYIPFVIAGGVGSLSEPLKLPKEYKFVRDRIDLFVDRFGSIDRMILINHEDCRQYEAFEQLIGKLFLNRVSGMVERQKIDLAKVSEALAGIVGRRLKFESYFAKFTGDGSKKVTFERVAG